MIQMTEALRYINCAAIAGFLVMSWLISYFRHQPISELVLRCALWSLMLALLVAQMRAGIRRTPVDFLTWWITASLFVMAVGAAWVRADQMTVRRRNRSNSREEDGQ